MKKSLLIAPVLLLSACAPAVTYKGPTLVALTNASATVDGAEVPVTNLGDLFWVIDTQQYKLSMMPVPNRPGLQGFEFTLVNKSSQTIKVIWDESVISSGTVPSAVYHQGVKFIDAEKSKPASLVPTGGTLVDGVYPTNVLRYDGGRYGAGWVPGTFYNKVEGTASVLLALEVEGKRQNLMLRIAAK